MKWFTRDFLTGGLDEAEWQRRIDNHEQHMAEIEGRLNSGAELLAGATNLHDAQLREWSHISDTLRLRLLIGDLQVGYEWANLTYNGAALVSATAEELNTWSEKAYEIGADEIDVVGPHRFEHRALLWPEGEFAVQFTSLTVDRSPATPQDRVSTWD